MKMSHLKFPIEPQLNNDLIFYNYTSTHQTTNTHSEVTKRYVINGYITLM